MHPRIQVNLRLHGEAIVDVDAGRAQIAPPASKDRFSFFFFCRFACKRWSCVAPPRRRLYGRRSRWSEEKSTAFGEESAQTASGNHDVADSLIAHKPAFRMSWIRFLKARRPQHLGSIDDRMVPLQRNHYGHSLAGLL